MNPKRQTVELVDGRLYYSFDGWATVFLETKKGRHRMIVGEEADRVRLLVAYGAAD